MAKIKRKYFNPKLSEQENKTAYRLLALKYHPDRKNGNEEKFKEISAQYLEYKKQLFTYEKCEKHFAQYDDSGLNFNFKQTPDGVKKAWEEQLKKLIQEELNLSPAQKTMINLFMELIK